MNTPSPHVIALRHFFGHGASYGFELASQVVHPDRIVSKLRTYLCLDGEKVTDMSNVGAPCTKGVNRSGLKRLTKRLRTNCQKRALPVEVECTEDVFAFL